jgi:hypothetical protein
MIPLPAFFNKEITKTDNDKDLIAFLKSQPEPGYMYLNVSKKDITIFDKYEKKQISIPAQRTYGKAISVIPVLDKSGLNFMAPFSKAEPQFKRHIEYYCAGGFTKNTDSSDIQHLSFKIGPAFLGSSYCDSKNEQFGKLYYSPEGKLFINSCSNMAIPLDTIFIFNIQKDLKNLGYDIPVADGVYSEKTKNALKAFEKKTGILLSENISAETVKHIRMEKRK